MWTINPPRTRCRSQALQALSPLHLQLHQLPIVPSSISFSIVQPDPTDAALCCARHRIGAFTVVDWHHARCHFRLPLFLSEWSFNPVSIDVGRMACARLYRAAVTKSPSVVFEVHLQPSGAADSLDVRGRATTVKQHIDGSRVSLREEKTCRLRPTSIIDLKPLEKSNAMQALPQ